MARSRVQVGIGSKVMPKSCELTTELSDARSWSALRQSVDWPICRAGVAGHAKSNAYLQIIQSRSQCHLRILVEWNQTFLKKQLWEQRVKPRHLLDFQYH